MLKSGPLAVLNLSRTIADSFLQLQVPTQPIHRYLHRYIPTKSDGSIGNSGLFVLCHVLFLVDEDDFRPELLAFRHNTSQNNILCKCSAGCWLQASITSFRFVYFLHRSAASGTIWAIVLVGITCVTFIHGSLDTYVSQSLYIVIYRGSIRYKLQSHSLQFRYMFAFMHATSSHNSQLTSSCMYNVPILFRRSYRSSYDHLFCLHTVISWC